MVHLAPHVDKISQAVITGGPGGQEDVIVCLCGVGPPWRGPRLSAHSPGGHAQRLAEECGGGGAGVEGQSQRHGRGAQKGTAWAL